MRSCLGTALQAWNHYCAAYGMQGVEVYLEGGADTGRLFDNLRGTECNRRSIKFSITASSKAGTTRAHRQGALVGADEVRERLALQELADLIE